MKHKTKNDMTQFKGTKGKWKFSNGDIISDLEDLEGDIICVNPNESGEFPESGKNWKANALLISKAPEMLEMLERLSTHYGLLPNDRDEIKQLIIEATEL